MWCLQAHGNFVQNLQMTPGDIQWKHGRAPLVGSGVTAWCVLIQSTCAHTVAQKITLGCPVPLLLVPLTTIQLSAKWSEGSSCQALLILVGTWSRNWSVAQQEGQARSPLAPIPEEGPCVVAVRAASHGGTPVCAGSKQPRLSRHRIGFAQGRHPLPARQSSVVSIEKETGDK